MSYDSYEDYFENRLKPSLGFNKMIGSVEKNVNFRKNLSSNCDS